MSAFPAGYNVLADKVEEEMEEEVNGGYFTTGVTMVWQGKQPQTESPGEGSSHFYTSRIVLRQTGVQDPMVGCFGGHFGKANDGKRITNDSTAVDAQQHAPRISSRKAESVEIISR